MKGDSRRWLRGAVIGLGAGVVALAATHLPLFETYEHRTFDLRIRLFADARRADPNIVAVVIDQKSLDEIARPQSAGGLKKGWPWPRDFHAMVVRYLAASGARAIVFDVVFSEPSVYNSEFGDDATFAEAADGRRVVHAIMLTKEAAATADKEWNLALRSTRLTTPLKAIPAFHYDKATVPIPPLLSTAAGLGSIAFQPDDDGVARAIQLAVPYAPLNATDAVDVRSLPLIAAEIAGEKMELAGQGRARTFSVNGRPIPLDEDGRMILRFHGGEGTYRHHNFAEVLRSAMRAEAGEPVTVARPEDFRGKIVLVGATAAGLLDLRTTPIRGVVPGFLIHATALDNLLHANPVRRASAPLRTTLVLMVGVACGALAMARGARYGVTGMAVIAVGYVGTAAWLFGARGFWIDVVGPGVAHVVAWGAATGYAYVTEGRERRFLRDAFSRYLAPDVVAALVAQPGRLALGGESRELTVMFADVAGFTTLAEGRNPQEVVTLMNECFGQFTGVIQAEGGTVDKFIGDAVMAFWNAPVAQPDHAARALRASRKLLQVVRDLNASWSTRGLPALGMRVGVATGPAVVGNVGSHTKFNYTVMGDTVNLASRVEGAAKVYGTSSLITDATATAAGGAIALRELDRLRVKGKSEAVTVYEVLMDDAPAFGRAEALRAYAKGLEAYRARAFDEAAAQFEAALTADPDDGPSSEMKDRCQELKTSPPPADWRGEHVLTSK